MLPVSSAGQFALEQPTMPWPPCTACPVFTPDVQQSERWTSESDGNSPLQPLPQEMLVRFPNGDSEGACFGPPPGWWDDGAESLLVPPGLEPDSEYEPQRAPRDHAMPTAPSCEACFEAASSTAMEWLDRGQLVLENAFIPFEEQDLAALHAAYTKDLGEYFNPKGYGNQ